MRRVDQIDSKTWEVSGATIDEVREATKRASQKRSPIDHGNLRWPMRLPLKVMVGMSTYDTYDDRNNRGTKTHLPGPGVYETEVSLRQKGSKVEVKRRTAGLLAPAAEIGTNLGRAIEAELRRR